MLPDIDFIRLIENSTYKIYEPLGIKLLTRFRLGLADSLNPLSSCSLETDSALHVFLRSHIYDTSHRVLMNDWFNRY